MSSGGKIVEKPKISKIKIVDISPKLEGDAAKLLPTVLRPETCSFQLDNVSVAIASGIRRVILSGVRAKRLTFELDDYKTNDPHARLHDFVQNRINSIPIMQSIDDATQYSIDIKNDSPIEIEVMTSDLKVVKGSKKPMFDETIPIVTLQPERFLQIDNIFVESGYEYEHGTYCLTDAAKALSLDVEPYDMYTGKGVSSSESDPRSHYIEFNTNGTIDCKKIVADTCDTIIQRLKKIRDLSYTMVEIGYSHVLAIIGEDDTTGEIIAKTMSDIYPEIEGVTQNSKGTPPTSTMTLTIIDSDPDDKLKVTIKYAIDQLEIIKKSFV